MRVSLRHGKKYRATLKLHGFEDFAPDSAVKGKLEEAGFIHVTVEGFPSPDRTAVGIWNKGDITVETQDISSDFQSVVMVA